MTDGIKGTDIADDGSVLASLLGVDEPSPGVRRLKNFLPTVVGGEISGGVALAQANAVSTRATAAMSKTLSGAPFVRTAGSFASGDGGGGLYVRTAATPTDLPAPARLTLTDGGMMRWAGPEFPLELGAKGDGSTDNSSFFTDMAGTMSGYGGAITARRGQFKTNAALVIPKGASFFGAGRDATLIDALGSGGSFANSAVVQLVGDAPVSLPALSSNVLRGALNLPFVSAHGLAADDIVLLYNQTNYSGSRYNPIYRAGEYCQVDNLQSSTQVNLAWQTYGEGEWSGVTGSTGEGSGGTYTFGGYDKSTLAAYKCSGFASGRIQGLAVRAPGAGTNGAVRAILVKYAHRVLLHDLFAIGSDNAAMSLENSLRIFGWGLFAGQRGNTGTYGTQYGLVVVGCQQVDIGQSDLAGERCGLEVGNNGNFSIINRGMHLHDSIVRGRTPGIPPVGFHGCTEWSSIRNVRAFGGGALWAGNHNVLDGLEIQSLNAGDYAVLGTEWHGWDHVIRNIRGYTAAAHGGGLIDIGGATSQPTASTVAPGQLRLEDIYLYAPAQTAHLCYVSNHGSPAAYSIEASNLHWAGEAAVAGTSALLAVATVSGNNAARIDLDQMRPGAAVKKVALLGSSDLLVANTKVAGLADSGVVTGNTTTGSGILDVAVTFAHPFPRPPHIIAQSNTDTTGADKIDAIAVSVSATGFTFRFRRIDAVSNFGAAVAVTGSWTAQINE